jgi:hypothetical protein
MNKHDLKSEVEKHNLIGEIMTIVLIIATCAVAYKLTIGWH